MRFIPAAFLLPGGTPPSLLDETEVTVTGTVVQIHEEHRWYRVRFELTNGTALYETFKF